MTAEACPGTIATAAPAITRRMMPAEPGRMAVRLRNLAHQALPLLVMLLLIGVIWQVACSHPGCSLLPPSTVWTTSRELILDPFYDRGGLDNGPEATIGQVLDVDLPRPGDRWRWRTTPGSSMRGQRC